LDGLVNAISLKDKKALTSVSGIGPKAGAQILLDLTDKVQKLRSELLFGEREAGLIKEKQTPKISEEDNMRLPLLFSERENLGEESLLNDAIEACEELGFSKIDVIPIAQRVMRSNSVQGVEGLVRLVLKEF
jgi:Holliday junction resolvasome RuvABC DNA-binding subunit